jgi:glycosyltransferase involved in cell wall biosynthesis
MNLRKTNRLNSFIAEYTNDRPIQALSYLFSSPDTCLEDLDRGDPLSTKLVNYAHSLAFGVKKDRAFSSKELLKTLPKSEKWNKLRSLIQIHCQSTPITHPVSQFIEDLENSLERKTYQPNSTPLSYSFLNKGEKKYLTPSLHFYRNYIYFLHSSKSRFPTLQLFLLPLFPLSYQVPKNLLQALNKPFPKQHTLVLCIQNYALNWKKLYSQFFTKRVLLCFPSTLHFLHSFQFPYFSAFLLKKNTELLLFDWPWHHTQLSGPYHFFPSQNLNKEWKYSLENENNIESLREYSRHLSDEYYSNHLGVARQASYFRVSQAHKNSEMAHFSSSPISPPSLKLNAYLNKYKRTNMRRIRKSKRVAHIVPQYIEGVNHAPSQLLNSLLKYSPSYKHHIFTSEYFMLRSTEYPYDRFFQNIYISAPHSEQRSHKKQNFLHKYNISLIQNSGTHSYKKTARDISIQLSEMEIDYAIFHEDNPIHLLIAQECDVPVKIYMEHGTVPIVDFFDAMILNHPNEIPYYSFSNTKLFANINQVDVSKRWLKTLTPKTQWGIPEEAVVLCTVSNRLGRLSFTMIQLVIQLLKKHPEVYYLTIGNDFPVQFFSKDPEIMKRIINLGPQEYAPHFIRSADIYLNDFPIGGGLTIIEAMAAGLPIVSFYNENGLPPSRHVGHYFGKENCIFYGDTQGYLELASKLISCKKMRTDWKKKSLNAYQKMNSPQKYGKNLEQILNQFE